MRYSLMLTPSLSIYVIVVFARIDPGILCHHHVYRKESVIEIRIPLTLIL